MKKYHTKNRNNNLSLKTKSILNQINKYHPDQNPNNASANEKIKKIIDAHEYLTKESAENVFRESEREEYFNYMQKFKIDIPNTTLSINREIGVTAPPEDWIYAAYLGKNA